MWPFVSPAVATNGWLTMLYVNELGLLFPYKGRLICLYAFMGQIDRVCLCETNPKGKGNHSSCHSFTCDFTDCRIFNCKGEEVKRVEFQNGGNYVSPVREGSYDLFGDRVLKLGTNM